jgi:phosphatidylserine/phosphatidylglycerophosphate/cardiolipin synthase-like enzyme
MFISFFPDKLLKAANRGFRIRVLVDDMDREGRDLGAAVADSHLNIEVRKFNTISRETSRIIQFVTRAGSVTRRMHKKTFTVDDQVTILGGRDIGDEYYEIANELAERFDQNIEKGAFRLELQKDRDGSDKIVWHALSDGKQEVFNVEPHTTFWQRLSIGFLSILPIESQL